MLHASLRRHLLQSFSEEELSRWYDGLVITEGTYPLEISVEFPHPLFAQWFEENVKEAFERHAGLFFGPGHVLRYRTPAGRNIQMASSFSEFFHSSVDFPFGHEFTFESFFTNQKNLFALASVRDAAKSREVKFNPLVLTGEAGTGKSHLLRSMANELSKRHDQSVLFLGNVDDLAELSAALPRDVPMALRTHMSGYKFFFLDDLQHLASYPGLGRMVLILFNMFHDLKRLMVFTANQKPADMDFLPEALRTRLDWGLSVPLSRPDLDVRLKYTQSHCQRKKIGLTKAQMLTLAQNHADFRTLTGVLNKFQAYRELLKRDISDSIFENILGHETASEAPRLSPEDIIRLVAEQFELDVSDLVGNRRHKEVVAARQVAMLLCREILALSYPALGKLFGGKDHSTVLYAIRKVQEMQLDNPVMKEKVASLRKMLAKANTAEGS